jgi:hypothetical protein
MSEAISGPLPLLRTLKIRMNYYTSNMLTAPPLPLFSGAANLEEFDFKLDWNEPLNCFIFPNLTTFKLTTDTAASFNASDLFNFLKASPMLRTVEASINGGLMLENIPREMTVLPNVETFSLHVHDHNLQVYHPAVHISCPRAKYTSLTQNLFDVHITHLLEAFPDAVLWEAIIRQYTASPVEQVTLEIGDDGFHTFIEYFLTFQSSDATAIRLGFEFGNSGEADEHIVFSREETSFKIFSQACQTIRSHPLLSHVKRLHIRDRTGTFGVDRPVDISEVVGGLFRSLGPLEKLTIHGCDLRVFLAPHLPEFESESTEPVFPSVKELIISKPWMVDKQRCMDAIVELAKSQHELDKPFDLVAVRARGIPVGLEDRLEQWVGAAECYEM